MMATARSRPYGRRGIAALIEIIVVLVLVLAGFSVYLGMMGGGRGGELMDPTGTTTAMDLHRDLAEGHAPVGRPAEDAQPPSGGAPAPRRGTDVVVPSSIPGQAIGRARGEQCLSNLRQLRMMIQMATDDAEGTFPSSLTDVPGSIEVRTCPVGKQDYTYDPTTGKVYCTTPGHEGY